MVEVDSAAAKQNTTASVRETFPVLEMTCAACAVSVESMLKNTPGVSDAAVNFANQTAWVEYDPDSGILLIHVLDLVDKDEWVALIKNRYEALLMEIFE